MGRLRCWLILWGGRQAKIRLHHEVARELKKPLKQMHLSMGLAKELTRPISEAEPSHERIIGSYVELPS